MGLVTEDGLRLKPGSVVADRYEIVRKVGQGGMGIVFEGLDRKLNGDRVAIKVLFPHLAEDEQTFKRFLNEVRLARVLTHPNIVRFHDIGQDASGLHYITMEYVDGPSLKGVLSSDLFREYEDSPPLQFDQGAAILYQVLAGVTYAHSKGIIHRDLKPANVLIDSSGAVKLADFGTARMIGVQSGLTASGETLGTPDYMSPEQIRGELLDTLTDVYSLGIMAYEIAVGSRPFEADTVVAIAYKHLNEQLPRFASPEQGIPLWYEELVLKATKKDKHERLASVALLAEMLARQQPGVLRGLAKSVIAQMSSIHVSRMQMSNIQMSNIQMSHVQMSNIQGDASSVAQIREDANQKDVIEDSDTDFKIEPESSLDMACDPLEFMTDARSEQWEIDLKLHDKYVGDNSSGTKRSNPRSRWSVMPSIFLTTTLICFVAIFIFRYQIFSMISFYRAGETVEQPNTVFSGAVPMRGDSAGDNPAPDNPAPDNPSPDSKGLDDTLTAFDIHTAFSSSSQSVVDLPSASEESVVSSVASSVVSSEGVSSEVESVSSIVAPIESATSSSTSSVVGSDDVAHHIEDGLEGVVENASAKAALPVTEEISPEGPSIESFDSSLILRNGPTVRPGTFGPGELDKRTEIVKAVSPTMSERQVVPVLPGVVNNSDDVAPSKHEVNRHFSGVMKFGVEEAADERRSLRLDLVYTGDNIQGDAEISGLGSFKVDGNVAFGGVELRLINDSTSIRLSGVERDLMLRGSFVFSGEHRVGSWQVHGGM